MLKNKTTLHIVAGFKGAGKTTYINNNLLICGKKAAVLLNEHGAASIREGFTVRDLKSALFLKGSPEFLL